MRRLRGIFNRIIGWLWRPRRSRPEDIPKKLDAQTLEQVMKEARFLYSHHAVDITALLPGELPGLPKRADKE